MRTTYHNKELYPDQPRCPECDSKYIKERYAGENCPVCLTKLPES